MTIKMGSVGIAKLLFQGMWNLDVVVLPLLSLLCLVSLVTRSADVVGGNLLALWCAVAVIVMDSTPIVPLVIKNQIRN